MFALWWFMQINFIFITKCQVLEALMNQCCRWRKNWRIQTSLYWANETKLREVFKGEIGQITKEELKEIEKLSSSVSFLQKHVRILKESNVALQEKYSNLEHLVKCNNHYSRWTCLRISNIPCEKDGLSENWKN